MDGYNWKSFFEEINLKPLLFIGLIVFIIAIGLILMQGDEGNEKKSLSYYVYCYHSESDRYVRYDITSYKKPSIENDPFYPSFIFVQYYPKDQSKPTIIKIKYEYHVTISKELNPWIEANFKVVPVKR